MREQVCTYMCPWPRIQAAMLDEDSLTVTYNGWRGEPRARQKERHTDPETQFGDCIDCNLCVAVCPQGIDIRDGQQLECITCALCIDACNSVMTKIDKPRGLISYATLKDYDANQAGQRTHTTWRSFVRPRTIVYTTLWSLAGAAMLFMLLTRDRLDINVLHDRNPVFVALSDGGFRNGYTVKILNMEARERTFRLSIDGIAGASLALAGSGGTASRTLEITAEPDKQRTVKIYVTAYPAHLTGESTPFRFTVEELDGDETAPVRRQVRRAQEVRIATMQESPQDDTGRRFTGLHMLGVVCGFFAVVIAANAALAYYAMGKAGRAWWSRTAMLQARITIRFWTTPARNAP